MIRPMEKDIIHALEILRSGGIILYPTDTVWGIGCDATDAAAIDRIYRLKERDDSKSMIILVADERAILKYTASPDPAVFEILENTDRPTTIIYENALDLPDNLINSDGSIAIRIVQEPFCRALIKRLGKPIVSTSANQSGKPAPRVFSEITAPIRQGVDYIVAYRQDDDTISAPSRIIRMAADGTTVVLRS